MNPPRKLFAHTELGHETSALEWETLERTGPERLIQNEADPPIPIDPNTISHAYMALTLADSHRCDFVLGFVERFNDLLQEKLWQGAPQPKVVCFALQPDERGFPDQAGVPAELAKAGLAPQSSIVIQEFSFSLDTVTMSQLLIGFAFADSTPRLIVPRQNGCVPA